MARWSAAWPMSETKCVFGRGTLRVSIYRVLNARCARYWRRWGKTLTAKGCWRRPLACRGCMPSCLAVCMTIRAST